MKNTDTNTLKETFKNWTVPVLTVLFLLLYTAALLGWVKPLADAAMIGRLEPILFVIAGYYFGRFPSIQTERALRGELVRQSLKTDAAADAKEQARAELEALEEKIRNARTVLSFRAAGERTDPDERNRQMRFAVKATLEVLDS